jgi:hypothetical protein
MPRTLDQRASFRSRRIWAGLTSVNLRQLRDRHRWSRRKVARLYNNGDPREPWSPGVLRYWERMAADPNRYLNIAGHGGRRWSKLPRHVEGVLRAKLFLFLRRFKVADVPQIAIRLSAYATALVRQTNPNAAAINLSRSYVYRVFKSWRWSLKVPVRVHLHKYRPENLRLYLHYISAITWIDPSRLKFLDEATYAHRGSSCLPLLLSIIPYKVLISYCRFCASPSRVAYWREDLSSPRSAP